MKKIIAERAGGGRRVAAADPSSPRPGRGRPPGETTTPAGPPQTQHFPVTEQPERRR